MTDYREPAVSVVIPAYNPPINLFQKCITTVLGQELEQIEIIVVDDGSEPDKARAIDNIAALDSRIRVIHQPNGGEGAARNRGLDSARGEYIVFVDSDDGLAKGWLCRAVQIADNTDSSIVMGRVMQVPGVPDAKECSSFCSRSFSIDEFWMLQRDFLLTSTHLVGTLPYLDPGVCSKLIRRDCISGLRFPVGLKLSSDQVFNHEMLRRAQKYVVTDAVAYYYVSNGESISHVYNPDAASVMMKSMSLVEDTLIDDKRVRQAFYFRVLMEIGTAIQFAAFSDRHPTTFLEKKEIIAEAVSEPLFTKALHEVNIAGLPGFSWKLKAILLKHNLPGLYIRFKQLSDHE